MLVDIKIDAERCDFRQCENNKGGKCNNIKSRLDCLVMALAILGIGEQDINEQAQERL